MEDETKLEESTTQVADTEEVSAETPPAAEDATMTTEETAAALAEAAPEQPETETEPEPEKANLEGEQVAVPSEASGCAGVWVPDRKAFIATVRARDEHNVTPTHALLVSGDRIYRIYGYCEADTEQAVAFWGEKVLAWAKLGGSEWLADKPGE